MKVEIQSSDSRVLRIEATVAELAALYVATRTGRKTNEQKALLEGFGDMLVSGDSKVHACAMAKMGGVSTTNNSGTDGEAHE